jgi:hypothetical protein
MATQTQNVSNLQEAVQVLIQGVQIGQSKGVYSFEDSAIIKNALDFLNTKPEEEAVPEMEEVDAREPG